MPRKAYLLFTVLIALMFFSAPVLAQNASSEDIPGENITLSFEVSITPAQRVCLFFVAVPSFIPQDEISIFTAFNVNCGNQPINGTTNLSITNSTGHVMKNRSMNIFLNNSLDEQPVSIMFSASVPNGTYYINATTVYNTTTGASVSIGRDFDVVLEAHNLTRRLYLPIREKEIIGLDIVAPREKLNVSLGNTLLVPIKVINKGNMELRNISLVPIVSPGWNSTTAYVDSLPFNETVTRNLAVTPGEGVRPTTYLVLVMGKYNEETLDQDFFIVDVKRPGEGSLSIVEYPIIFESEQLTAKNFSVLVKNTGIIPLHDVSIKFENEESCLYSAEFPKVEELKVAKTATITAEVIPKEVLISCNVTVIAFSDEGAVSAKTSTINVKARMGFPAVLFTRALEFIMENPVLVILAIILIVIAIRTLNSMRYRLKKKASEEETPEEEAIVE